MAGLYVLIVSLCLGVGLSAIDTYAGLAVIIIGGICAVVMTWYELS